MRARTLDQCLDADAAMARLARQAERLVRLQRILEETAPAALKRYCRVANYKDKAPGCQALPAEPAGKAGKTARATIGADWMAQAASDKAAAVVVIHADNGAVAAKLRQLEPTLRANFIAGGAAVGEIRIGVRPRAGGLPAPRAQPRTLSRHAQQSLTRLAREIGPDSPLKTALERLAARAGASQRDDALEEE